VIAGTIPNGTVMPAGSHYLIANSAGYSLGAYATPDATYTADIPSTGVGLALFTTANTANFDVATRLDAAGYADGPALYREGAGFPTGGLETTSDLQYGFYRDLSGGTPKDTQDNATDFVAVDAAGSATGQGTHLGAPGPVSLGGPTVLISSALPVSLLDPGALVTKRANRLRDPADTGTNATNGTMTVRRTITNNTNQPIQRLYLRFVALTTDPDDTTTPGTADFRLLNAPDSLGANAITLSDTVTTKDVFGTTLEEPPTQALGGGLNSTLQVNGITPATPLTPGSSINVQVRFGVEGIGNYEFRALLEADFSGAGVRDNYMLLRGDVDRDRLVDVNDAVLALRAITGVVPATDALVFSADVNEDGALDVTDVVELLQWAVGIGPGQTLGDNLVTAQGKVGEQLLFPDDL
jgi:hypothetical protein